MYKYKCTLCSFYTDHKSKYLNHLETKKHKKAQKKTECNTLRKKCNTECNTKCNLEDKKKTTPYQCQYCDQVFSTRQSKYRHIRYVCKKSKDEDFKELARLLNIQLKEQRTVSESQQKHVESQNKRIENLEKQIEKLTSKLQIQCFNDNRTQNAHITNTFNIANFKNTDYSHLTTADYLKCIGCKSYCVKALIEKIHFDKDKPENMNIYISSIKGNFVMIYQNDQWQIDNREYAINELYDKNEFHLETWYEENKEKYPKMISSFEICMKKRSDNEVLNDIKQEILMMLYNKRNMIPIDTD